MTRRRFLFISSLAALMAFLLSTPALAGIDTTATWKFKTSGPVYSSPTYDSGYVYIGSDNGYLYCLRSDSGKEQWKFATAGLVRCRPAVADTSVYIESEDGFVYAVGKKSGKLLWATDVGNTMSKRVLPDLSAHTGNSWDYMQSSPCVDSGVVYIGSGDSCVYALNARTGAVQWRVRTGNVVRSSPCVVGTLVYAGSWDGSLYAFNKADGSIAWQYATGGIVQCSPVVANGLLFCGSRNGYFYALDALQGTLVWQYLVSSSNPFIESSAVVVNGTVYVGSSDVFKVYAFDAATGHVLWTSVVQGDTWSSPLYKNGVLYIGLETYAGTLTAQRNGALLALNATTGAIKSSLPTGTSPFIGGVVSSPAASARTIYFGGLDGYVCAMDTGYVTPPRWCAADFSKATYDGKEGFYVPGWSTGAIRRVMDRSLGLVLLDSATVSPSLPSFALQRDSLPMHDGELFVHAVSFQVYLPATMPLHGIVSISLANSIHDSVAAVDTIGVQAIPGGWTTLWITRLDSLQNLGHFDLTKPASMRVTVSYPAPYDTTRWSGKLFFDNLWLYGVSFASTLPDGVTEVEGMAKDFHLVGNYPNPFNPATTIEYRVGSTGPVSLRVYDLLGREVATLVNEVQRPGTYRVRFDARNISSGVYYSRLASGAASETRAMILMK